MDLELIEQCKKGDHRAQMQLYRLHIEDVYRVSFRIVGSQEDAEEICQDAFLKAFSKLDTFDPKLSFSRWIKGIAIHQAIDRVRSRKELFSSMEEWQEMQLKDTSEIENEEKIYILHKANRIKEEIQKLPDGYRITLSLHLFEEYNFEEIAEILKLKSSSVRSQYLRGKKKLIEALKKAE